MAWGSAERYIARIMFQNKIHSSSGQSYENLFTLVLSQSNKNFELVKAHGNSGDKKNDGFDKQTGTYYQVFAPEDITKTSTIRDACNKLHTDFEGLYQFWNPLCEIHTFYFVINDRYKGVAPEVHQELFFLEKQYPSVVFRLLLAKDLEDIFMELSEDSIISIIGCVPNPASRLDYSALSSVIDHLMNTPAEEPTQIHFTVPDFDEKIAFNGLSETISTQLRSASYQVGHLERYFNLNSEHTRADLQSRFISAYQQVTNTIDKSIPNCSDLIFVQMIDYIYPNGTIAIRNAILILMAYYFEACDIFEPPNSEGREN